jgi:hypothetical protein
MNWPLAAVLCVTAICLAWVIIVCFGRFQP